MNPLESVAKLKAAKQAFTLLDEFQRFAIKGNVIDLAVGVIIGSAFAKIIDSLVKNILMPLIAVLVPGKMGYVDWKWTINGHEIPYGLFLGEVVNFLIVAVALFFFTVKFLGWVTSWRKAKAESEVKEPPPPTLDQELLMEIRDLLKSRA